MYVQEDVFMKVGSCLNLRPNLFTDCKVDVVLRFRNPKNAPIFY